MRVSNKNAPAEMSREGLSIFFDDFTLSHFQVCIKGNSEELCGPLATFRIEAAALHVPQVYLRFRM